MAYRVAKCATHERIQKVNARIDAAIEGTGNQAEVPSGPLYVAYLRVSTREQEDSGLGIEAQRATINQEAQRRGWLIAEEFIDAGSSGKSIVGRDGMVAALARVRQNEISGLVAAKLDRISRSVVDFAGLMKTAESQGWNLVALDLGIDLETPSGRLLARVMASFAEYERELIGCRTSDALMALQAQGVRLGRPPALSEDVLASIIERHLAGWSSGRIARFLDAQAVPTAHGGQQWWPATVRAVLRSQAARQIGVRS